MLMRIAERMKMTRNIATLLSIFCPRFLIASIRKFTRQGPAGEHINQAYSILSALSGSNFHLGERLRHDAEIEHGSAYLGRRLALQVLLELV